MYMGTGPCARFSFEIPQIQVSFVSSCQLTLGIGRGSKGNARKWNNEGSLCLWQTPAGWQAGHAGVETADGPPVMTADNWNVTDFYMIADKLHKHESTRQMSGP